MNMKQLRRNLTGVTLSAVLFLTMAFTNQNVAMAAKDTTKPSLTVKQSMNSSANGVTFSVKASDASGIKELKYAYGKQVTKYFKSSGENLELVNGAASLSVNQSGTYTFYTMDKAGNTKIKKVTLSSMDDAAPVVELSYSVMDQVATVKVNAADLESGITSLSYVAGNVDAQSDQWASATDITGQTEFTVTDSDTYTVKAVDSTGNATVQSIKVNMEFKAVWISFLEFKSTGYTKEEFTSRVDEMFDNVLDLGMNAVVVQVRPYSDAMYKSKYFPWSKYVSGEQGTNPGFDPLTIMVDEAHSRGLEIHAWVNPYRVTTGNTDVNKLSDDNPAKKWLTDSDESNDRNVLSLGGNLYYNPASAQVRKLIVNGVKEIVSNYAVDGIHFDDYFYPGLNTKYATIFDNVEYNTYAAKMRAAGKDAMKIADWRRNNVNTLVKSVYKTIHEIKPNAKFGISPHGNIDNLKSDHGYYVDIDTWLSKDGYVDYICPQLYWSFKNKYCPYDKLLDKWVALRTNPHVNIYAGLATYRAGSSEESGAWKNSSILADMVEYSRETESVDGYIFFRYEHFYKKACLPAVEELLSVLEER